MEGKLIEIHALYSCTASSKSARARVIIIIIIATICVCMFVGVVVLRGFECVSEDVKRLDALIRDYLPEREVFSSSRSKRAEKCLRCLVDDVRCVWL